MKVKEKISVAPDFSMKDSDGRLVRLSDYKGKKNVFLVFNRGFGCPYCRKHMAELRQNYRKFTERNTEVIAIGPEDAKSFADWWHREKMPFPGIPDPKHIIANTYGQQVKPLKFGRMPAMVVVDREGKIRYRHYGEDMSDIPSDEEILSLLDEINSEREPLNARIRRR
jgi:peroxiredoxin